MAEGNNQQEPGAAYSVAERIADTGHTIRVCQKEGVPLAFQHERIQWRG